MLQRVGDNVAVLDQIHFVCRWKAGGGPGTQPRWMGLLSLTRRRKDVFQDNSFPLTVQSLAVAADIRGAVTW